MPTSPFLKTALKAAQVAEEVLLKYSGSKLAINRKSDQSPVTIADQEAEKKITAIITDAFPDHGFVGEEFGSSNTTAEYQWSIDPIDGTKNFIHGLPFFSTEIALLQNGVPILGVSNAPLLKRLVWAEKGKGAWLNSQKLSVSSVSELSNAYLSCGSLKHFDQYNLVERLVALNQRTMSLRSFGDSWSYTYLAGGYMDAVFEAHIKVWDVAASTIITQEAGGRVTDLFGKPFTPESTTFFASNGLLHNEVLSLLHTK
jgi:histidinol-phosphatase